MSPRDASLLPPPLPFCRPTPLDATRQEHADGGDLWQLSEKSYVNIRRSQGLLPQQDTVGCGDNSLVLI